MNTIIIGNTVYILSDTDDVVQKVGFDRGPCICGGGGPLGEGYIPGLVPLVV